jgi:hypothetical protein
MTNPYDSPRALVTAVEAPGTRRYVPWQVAVGGLLGGAVAAGYLLSRNADADLNESQSRTFLAVGIVLELVLGVLLYRDEVVLGLSSVLTVSLVTTAYQYARQLDRARDASLGAWEPHGWGRTFAIGFLFLLLRGFAALVIQEL